MHDRVPPEQHRQHIPNPLPEDDFERDLHPKRLAGEEQGPERLQPSRAGRTLADEKAITRQRRGLSEADLKQIPVLPEGTQLEQGATYIDLRDPDAQAFTAKGAMVAGPDNLYIPKSDVDHVLWNRLIGVTNPERLDRSDEA